jgi:uncharacterized protein (TIGR00725 family)
VAARERWIAVVGPGEASREEAEVAERVGEAVADARAVLVCGGRGGVMEAACRGAAARGGMTVGILPAATRAEANPWVRVALPTGLGEARNALVVRAADALVAVGGGWGTLSEIALALKARRPVIGLATWEPARGGAPVAGVIPARDPGWAVQEALRRIGHGEEPITA